MSFGFGYNEMVLPPRSIQICEDNQITNPSQLKVGQKYQRMRILDGCQGVITIVERPNNKNLSVKVKDEKGEVQVLSLGDLGIVSYRSGAWNDRNYLIPCQEVN